MKVWVSCFGICGGGTGEKEKEILKKDLEKGRKGQKNGLTLKSKSNLSEAQKIYPQTNKQTNKSQLLFLFSFSFLHFFCNRPINKNTSNNRYLIHSSFVSLSLSLSLSLSVSLSLSLLLCFLPCIILRSPPPSPQNFTHTHTHTHTYIHNSVSSLLSLMCAFVCLFSRDQKTKKQVSKKTNSKHQQVKLKFTSAGFLRKQKIQTNRTENKDLVIGSSTS